jgi:hypothetical protein
LWGCSECGVVGLLADAALPASRRPEAAFLEGAIGIRAAARYVEEAFRRVCTRSPS